MILSLACDTILIISQEALFCYPHRLHLFHSPQHSWGIRLFIHHHWDGYYHDKDWIAETGRNSAVQKRNAAVLLRKDGRLASQYAIEEGAWEDLGMGCMEWMQLQKKKQDQTNFFEIHLTLLHIFYVLFHSDTWMSLGGTRTIAYSNSTITNQFCLEIICCRVCFSFDFLIYPYYPAYIG